MYEREISLFFQTFSPTAVVLCTNTDYRSGFLHQAPFLCPERTLILPKGEQILKKASSESSNAEHSCASFTRRAKLLAHQVRHSVQAELECEICLESFTSQGELHVHQKLCGSHEFEEELDAEDFDPEDMSDESEDEENYSLKSKTSLKTHGQRKEKLSYAESKACFTQKSTLKRQQAVHSHNTSLVCDFCDVGFSTNSQLKLHQRKHANQKKVYACPICGKTLPSSLHVSQHIANPTICVDELCGSKETFPCAECNKYFKLKKHLKQHQVIHTRNTSLVCDLCEVCFSTNYQLKLHQRKHANQRKVYTCLICGKNVTTGRHYLEHVGSHDRDCKICGYHFSSTYALKMHQAVHTKTRDYICDVCGKGYGNQKRLQSHRSIHSNAKSYLCEVCGKGFLNITLLSTHRLVHGKEKLCLCTTCGKKFSTKTGVKNHEKSHMKERLRPNVCHICGDAFLQPHHLQNHLDAHSKERPFICMVCDKAFVLKHHLKAHLKTHTVDFR
ncbi:zinc finger protein OZF-like isoform X2 [Patiria miniata]|uniref:C2H2-type domain-containing protein n=1 Tax=Patiria miniata TaxID=46514 RepID=A0A913ZJK8_PATMI|nr:zinc finger protein OZF-like isoform X2 [Patiria miniata]